VASEERGPHGVLLVDKPEGVTSAGVVREVKRALGCKVGHLGTLDPFASGLLPLCVGEGTKIAQFLNALAKEYEGVVRLGKRTDTGDATGTTTEERPLPRDLSPARCDAVAASFLGERLQTPPMYSAVKREGVPLYRLARKGIEVERTARVVTLYSLALWPLDEVRVGLRTRCSKGTYIRVLAEEIAVALGSVGHLESLRRTGFGHFSIQAAVRLPLSPEEAARAVISPRRALADVAEVSVGEALAVRVCRGQVAALREIEAPLSSSATLKVVGPEGDLLAVLQADAKGGWRFARVMGVTLAHRP
jgi:tRNA pseudouridine55 synthase